MEGAPPSLSQSVSVKQESLVTLHSDSSLSEQCPVLFTGPTLLRYRSEYDGTTDGRRVSALSWDPR